MQQVRRHVVLVIAGVLLATASADALSQRETVCQAAIARAARTFITAELRLRARCRMLAAAGKECNPEARSSANEARLRRALRLCRGIPLGEMTAGSCAARATSTAALGDCLVTSHMAAVDALLMDQLGRPTR